MSGSILMATGRVFINKFHFFERKHTKLPFFSRIIYPLDKGTWPREGDASNLRIRVGILHRRQTSQEAGSFPFQLEWFAFPAPAIREILIYTPQHHTLRGEMEGLQVESSRNSTCISPNSGFQDSELSGPSRRQGRVIRTVYFSLSVNGMECEYIKTKQNTKNRVQ